MNLFSGVKFMSSKGIRLNLIKHAYSHNYSYVLNTTVVDKEEESKNVIEKNITIELLKKQQQQNNAFEITTNIKNLTLEASQIKQEPFKRKLHDLTNHIVLSISEEGHILAVVNHKDILKQWEDIKPFLLGRYKGVVIEKYLQGLEEKISNEEKLIGDIEQYRLFGCLFNNLYRDYSSPEQRQKTHLQAINYFPLTINETYTWGGKNEKDEISIQFKGEINAEQTPLKKINTFFERKGYAKADLQLTKYEGNYGINYKTGWINRVDFNMGLRYGNAYVKSQSIKIKTL